MDKRDYMFNLINMYFSEIMGVGDVNSNPKYLWITVVHCYF